MNKAELIDQLTRKLDTDRRTATEAVENVVDTIVRAVHKGDSVTITGFGVFEQRRRAARVARNPRTGETVRVKPTSVPAFRPGAQFKAVISGAQRLPAEGPAVKRGSATGRRPAKRTAKKTARKTTAKKAGRKRVAKKATKRAATKRTAKKATKRTAKKATKRTAKKATKRTAAKKTARKRPAKKATKRSAAKRTTKRTAKKTAKRSPARKTARRAPAKRGRR
jgi:DNA-binding protein HU-beta